MDLPETGKASWYADSENASGEPVDNVNDMTAAHRTLPFGTKVKVTRLDTGTSVIVTIQDRGPFSGRRILDLRPRPAKLLRMTTAGVVRVRIEAIGDSDV